jgi:hypothetical protein
MVRLSAALSGPLKCIPATFGKPFNQCEPHEIAVINFGIVGVNTLQAFDALFCVGVIARADHLNAVYQSNSWFPTPLSAVSIPRATDKLARLVEEHWAELKDTEDKTKYGCYVGGSKGSSR